MIDETPEAFGQKQGEHQRGAAEADQILDPGLAEPGTDFEAVTAGYVSMTPLHFDLMSHEALDQLRCWEPELNLLRSEDDR